MNKINLDSTENILEFHYPDQSELDSILKNLLSITNYWWVGRGDEINAFEIGVVSNEGNISPYDPRLYNWLMNCLDQAANYYYADRIKQLAISEAWMTRSKSMTSASSHSHQRSYISGILYLTDSNSYTTFESIPREVEHLENSFGIEDKESAKLHKVKSEKGKLLLFPSRIKHSVKVLSGQKDYRYTYIINTYPTGIISDYKTTYLEYYVKDIKDRYTDYVSRQGHR